MNFGCDLVYIYLLFGLFPHTYIPFTVIYSTLFPDCGSSNTYRIDTIENTFEVRGQLDGWILILRLERLHRDMPG